MKTKQLTVFLQNKEGRLEDLTKTLGEEGINISALSLAETEEYGIVRMIVSDTEKAAKALKAKEFTAKTTDVLSVVCQDIPGALHELLGELSSQGINVSYMYGYSNDGRARMIIKVSDIERALKLLDNFQK